VRWRERSMGVAAGREYVKVMWDWCCAERLQPSRQRVARDLVRCGELEATEEVLEELLCISRATLACRLGRLPRPKPQPAASRAPPAAVAERTMVGAAKSTSQSCDRSWMW
jgi:hypothetical protein